MAGLYIVSHRPLFFNTEDGLPDDVTLVLLFLDWWRGDATKTLVDQAVDDMRNRLRIQADEFLIRSLVAEWIMKKKPKRRDGDARRNRQQVLQVMVISSPL